MDLKKVIQEDITSALRGRDVSSNGIGILGNRAPRHDVGGLGMFPRDGLRQLATQCRQPADDVTPGSAETYQRVAEPALRHLGRRQHLRRSALHRPAKYRPPRPRRSPPGLR